MAVVVVAVEDAAAQPLVGTPDGWQITHLAIADGRIGAGAAELTDSLPLANHLHLISYSGAEKSVQGPLSGGCSGLR
jgi:hypothetical protein